MRYSLSVVLIGLVVSSVALAQTETQTPRICALHQPEAPRPHGLGTIIGIQDAARSRVGIAGREVQQGGAIDPHYLDDLRVTVRQDDGIVDNFDVPADVTVHVGDRVGLQGSYRSKASVCSYIPHMVVPSDVPMG